MIPAVPRNFVTGAVAALLFSVPALSSAPAATPAPLPRPTFSLPVSAVPEAPAALPRIPDPAGPPPPAAPPGFVYWKTVRARVTAYDPTGCCCGHSADGRTSTGDDAWVMDGVAVDPGAIPYGTRVFVPGAGWRKADDTGSAMREAGQRGRILVDLRVPSHRQAREWGVRQADLHLYRPAR